MNSIEVRILLWKFGAGLALSLFETFVDGFHVGDRLKIEIFPFQRWACLACLLVTLEIFLNFCLRPCLGAIDHIRIAHLNSPNCKVHLI